MARHVPDAALRAIQAEARPLAQRAAELRRDGQHTDSCAVLVDAGDLAALLDELIRRRAPRKPRRREGPMALALARLKPGDTVTISGVLLASLAKAKPVARRVLKNPEAQWRLSALVDGAVAVTRLDDGAPAPGKPRTLQTAEALAAMKPGEVKVVEVSARGGLHAVRQRARLLMGCEAVWRIQTLTHGRSRVTRTA